MIASNVLRENRIHFDERKSTLTTGSRLLLIGCVLVLFAWQTADAAHPFHTTFAEIEWNAETHRFEVALQLPGMQIDEELSRIHKRRINTETTADAETILENYITNRFKITDKLHDRCRIHWVGMEVELRDVWVYFEVELLKATNETVSSGSDSKDPSGVLKLVPRTERASSFEGLTLANRILTDVLAGQLNMASIIIGDQRASLNLTVEQTTCEVSF
ncbi:MAG: DUF6702 family protein [Planctomycetota bacterium]